MGDLAEATEVKEIVLTDRYTTDMLLMENVPGRFRRFLYAISPKPSKVIYLYNDPKVLKERKPNHPFEDLLRQEILFEEINRKLKPKQIKNEELDNTIKEVSEVVFEELLDNWK